MEIVFIEWLDQIYWSGYGAEFKEDNPDQFHRQLMEFSELHKFAGL